MPSEMKLSIIIISFNTKELLAQCLRSVYESCLPFSWEIIVVDNASSDGSAEMVAAAYPEVTVLRNKTNALFAKANNQGADVARGEYLLLLNSDTIVESGNIEKLVAFLDNASDRVACVGPTVLNGDRTVQSVGYALPSIRERIPCVSDSVVFSLSGLVVWFCRQEHRDWRMGATIVSAGSVDVACCCVAMSTREWVG